MIGVWGQGSQHLLCHLASSFPINPHPNLASWSPNQKLVFLPFSLHSSLPLFMFTWACLLRVDMIGSPFLSWLPSPAAHQYAHTLSVTEPIKFGEAQPHIKCPECSRDLSVRLCKQRETKLCSTGEAMWIPKMLYHKIGFCLTIFRHRYSHNQMYHGLSKSRPFWAADTPK